MTQVESPLEQVVATQLASQATAKELEPSAKARVVLAENKADAQTQAFRPTRRPPMAVLQVLDDDPSTAEFVRLRSDTTVIGRTTGHLTIQHDPQLSARHAEIARVAEEERYTWYLRDLESRNGTFIRVSQMQLQPGDELLIGSHRLRLELASGPSDSPAAPDEIMDTWDKIPPASSQLAGTPMLIEVLPAGHGSEFPLDRGEHWIGRDPAVCHPSFAGDLHLEPRHCRLTRGDNGTWQIEDFGSKNGTWMRIQRVPLSPGCAFRLGEQVFVITFP